MGNVSSNELIDGLKQVVADIDANEEARTAPIKVRGSNRLPKGPGKQPVGKASKWLMAIMPSIEQAAIVRSIRKFSGAKLREMFGKDNPEIVEARLNLAQEKRERKALKLMRDDVERPVPPHRSGGASYTPGATT